MDATRLLDRLWEILAKCAIRAQDDGADADDDDDAAFRSFQAVVATMTLAGYG